MSLSVAGCTQGGAVPPRQRPDPLAVWSAADAGPLRVHVAPISVTAPPAIRSAPRHGPARTDAARSPEAPHDPASDGRPAHQTCLSVVEPVCMLMLRVARSVSGRLTPRTVDGLEGWKCQLGGVVRRCCVFSFVVCVVFFFAGLFCFSHNMLGLFISLKHKYVIVTSIASTLNIACG